jgi:multicomponent Na+:H+ antiporter subunit D
MAVTQSSIDLSAALIMEPSTFADWLVILPSAICITTGAVLMMLRHSMRAHAVIAFIGLALSLACNVALVERVISSGPFTMVMGRWLPPFGIAFTADLTGALLALAGGIVALCAAYNAASEIDTAGRRYGFYPFMLLLMAGVNGAFLTGDIFNLYVWFEVLLISSFGMLVLGSHKEQIDGALKYAVLNLIATTLFLITVGFLYGIFGTLNMADITLKAREMGATAPLMTLATLFVVAFGMKAAAFPVNFWLPASYHTPRIVVSALFGGLLTKVGIYALLRVAVMLFPAQLSELSSLVAFSAILTMLLGAMGALAQSDIRRMLGFVVISGIGYMLAGIAMASQLGLGAAIFYALHSVVLMTALYFLAGHMARMGGSWSLTHLGGLYAQAPWFAGLALALFFAASGLPPFSGFWPKALLVKSALDAHYYWLAFAVLLSGFLITLAFGRVFLLAFWRPVPAVQAQKKPLAAAVVGGQAPSLLSVTLLTVLITVFGLFPSSLIDLSQQAAKGLLDPSAYIQSVFPQEAGQ